MASVSNPDSSLVKKKDSQGARSSEERVGWNNHHFVFSQKGGVLLTLQRLNENRRRPLTAFTLQVLGNVSSSGSGAVITEASHRGSALKVTEDSNLYEYFKLFFLILRIFGSHFTCRSVCVCTV